jgi:hypothetical protein
LVDKYGFPEFTESDAIYIPKEGSAILADPPPGCFGQGPRPLKTRSGVIGLNTASLVTYSRIYEILLILSKDTRRSMAKIELDLGWMPAPIAEIKCANNIICFPRFGGVFVNPTSRLAMKGNCISDCLGSETYHWELFRESEPEVLQTVSTLKSLLQKSPHFVLTDFLQ